MTRLHLITFILIFNATLIAQNKYESSKFFLDLLKKPTEKVIYTEYYFEGQENVKELIFNHQKLYKTEKIENTKNFVVKDSIILTKLELEYVVSEIEKNRKIENWSRGLIENSELISKKKINKIFQDKSKGWKYFNKKIGSGFYSFSKPIFLRENSICFSYSSFGSGSLSGSGGFSVFVKENGKWELFDVISLWIS
jgi:hypothetical protein